MKFMRKTGMLALLTACICAVPYKSAVSAEYPTTPIKLVVPVVPGGSADALARVLAEELAAAFKQSVVVENKPGAGMVIGLSAVARAEPDGYTLGVGPRGPLIIGPTVPGGLPFEPNEKFAAVAKVASVPIVIVANADTGIKSWDDVINKAKASSEGLSFASPGEYTSHRISVEIVAQKTNVKLNHIPYRGGGQALVDLLGGRVPIAALDLISVQQYIDSGRLNALGVTGSRRALMAPGISTMRELGYDVAPVDSWLGIFAPAGTPQNVIEKLSSQIEKSMKQPHILEKIKGVGLDPDFEPASVFAQTVTKDLETWKKLKDVVLPQATK
ncbi:MAG TPA: tripartite tricarboxylate transporter substrate binding protein [Eoetvoesiella sp.]